MTDQLIIGEKSSFDDFCASVAKRKIGLPKKKSIKETVPFSNKTYDFSAINGELYWEERELGYVFEIIAPTPEKLEELKTAFSCWVMNVQEEELHDPFIPDYHFIGTFDDIDPEDEDGLEKTTITVKFKAYPYMVANLPRVVDCECVSNTAKEFLIANNSAHPVMATLTAIFEETASDTEDCIIVIGGTAHSLIKGGETSMETELPLGLFTFKALGNCVLSISFHEEVF